jgi:hypothetical protein
MREWRLPARDICVCKRSRNEMDGAVECVGVGDEGTVGAVVRGLLRHAWLAHVSGRDRSHELLERFWGDERTCHG